MPDNGKDAAAGYVDAVKWTVGLSAGALAGVFLHPEQLPQHPPWIKYAIGLVLILLVINVAAGAAYIGWINRLRRVKERLGEIQGELSALSGTGDPQAVQLLTAEEDRLRREQKEAPAEMQSWYLVLIGSWCVAAIMIGLLFWMAIVWPQKKTEEIVKAQVSDPLRYTITQSAVHRTKGGKQAHTFLLNQQTGDMWQMICDPHGTVTAFRRVPRLDLNGNPEKEESGKKP